MFYTFIQNNSGGVFYGFKAVIIEAYSADMANALATTYDVYFDGVNKDIDCDCCGDRWDECDDTDGLEQPSVRGEVDIQKAANEEFCLDSIRVVYLNGKIVDYFKQI